MKTIAEFTYWISAAFIVIVMVAATASLVSAAVGGPSVQLLDLVGAPSEWLFPYALLLGVLWLSWAHPELSFYIFMAWLAVAVVTTLALPAWFYGSRRARLRTRASVLAGIVFISVAIRLLLPLIP
jgi:hypothetical protein